MSGMDDTVAVIGDWVPPSPSPRAFFTAMLGGENGSRSIPETAARNETEGLFLAPEDKSVVGNPDRKSATSPDHSAELGSLSELRSGPSGGLMERIAARAGFNAPKLNTEGIRPNDVMNPEARSTFLMLSPGLSPTALLESPVLLSNSLAQPSPTTGKFPFVPNGSTGNIRLVSNGPDRSKGNDLLEDNDSSSFVFKPVTESSSSFFGSEPKVSLTFPQQMFLRMEVSAQSDISLQSHNAEQPKFHLQADCSRSLMEKDVGNSNKIGTSPQDPGMLDNTVAGADQPSSPQGEEEDQKVNGDSTTGGGAPSEDGYNWRKYGHKQLKCSKYPRSYYKCTHANCRVKKKVEWSHEGHITEIIYKEAHNHPKPPPNRRGVIGGLDIPEQVGAQGGTDADQGWGNNLPQTSAPEWRHDNFEVISSPSDGPEFCNPNNTCLEAQNGTQLEPGDAVDAFSTFSNEEHDNGQANGSIPLCHDAEEDESESKRRKIEAYPTDMTGATRAIREPRVVVQTTSEVDILDDGYRWRKYGQKVVKGNPNPRSYYKCTSTACTVRKHVERASHDLKSVITTYEGKHNHDVPAARNSGHGNSGPGSAQPVPSGAQAHVHRPEPAQAHNGVLRFEGPGTLASFGLTGRPQLPPHSFGANHPRGLVNLTMAGLGAVHCKMPTLPIHPFLAARQQQSQVSEMGYMVPRGEPKPETVSDTGLNLSNSTSVYQQLMSRLTLGHQM